MIDIIQNPDAIATLKFGDIVAAGPHQYKFCHIFVASGYDVYFSRCDAEWEQERVKPEAYEESARRENEYCSDDIENNDAVPEYSYLDCHRHIRFAGRAVVSVEEMIEAIKNGTAKFNC